jgi:ribose/xylose/arabinose/galactoside ABC-type transport system permease subunit
MPILLLLLMLVFSLLSDRFLTPLNLTNILVQNVHIAICATGVFMIMVSGGCDLSIGYQMSVAAVLVAKLLSSGAMGVVPAILLGILICVALGCFNGVMSIALNSQPMIVTLGTMAIFQGISYLISGSKTYHNLPRSFMYLGQGKIFGKIPLNAVIALVIIVIVGIILSRTHIGRKIYAVGDNPEAAKLAGLNVSKIKILVFTCAGILVGISAILLAARSGSADSSTGTGIEFTGIIACVLSGVALKGGEGTLWKAIVAVFVLGVLSNGMQLINLGTYPQYIAKGIIMLVSLYLSNRTAKKA